MQLCCYWASVKMSAKWFIKESSEARSISKSTWHTRENIRKLWPIGKISSMKLFLVKFTTFSRWYHWKTVYIPIEKLETGEETKESTRGCLRLLCVLPLLSPLFGFFKMYVNLHELACILPTGWALRHFIRLSLVVQNESTGKGFKLVISENRMEQIENSS